MKSPIVFQRGGWSRGRGAGAAAADEDGGSIGLLHFNTYTELTAALLRSGARRTQAIQVTQHRFIM